MSIFSLIPARGGSKRLPGKNLKEFLGKPLIAYTIEKCLFFSDNVYVSSDSVAILYISNLYGSKILKRPRKISQDYSTPKEYLKHFFGLIKVKDDDIIVLCQPTSPLVSKEYYLEGIEKYKKGNYDVVISVFEDKRRIWTGQYSLLSENEKWYGENGAFYIFSKRNFIENDCEIGGKVGLVNVPKMLSIDIDTLEDFKMAEYAFGCMKKEC